MRRLTDILLTLTLTLLSVPLTADDTKQAKKSGAVTCVHHKTEARFQGMAFNHFVYLENRCSHAVTCTVKTDVNPKSAEMKLAPGEKKTHLTFRGSPASVFKAEISCKRRR